MNNRKRSLWVGAAVLACTLVASATSAQAATVKKGTGKTYYGCTNTVYMWKSGSTVRAYAQQDCRQKVKIMRPTVALSGNNGKTFVSKGKACKSSKSCRTATVSVKANKKWTYRASNSGSASFASSNQADFWWPTNTVAHATLKN
ncbi:hypothetical protein [Streptomyces atroolivaceus]|uniref:hypothetical protein n=1 Tax=Streptomyces atroolivaceus TaxID=66869 RepID=UPI002025343B|nr:hypothetical protein [Streptomyces atroolivaceus]